MKKVFLFLSCFFFAFIHIGSAQKRITAWRTKAVVSLEGYGKFEEIIIDSTAINEVYKNKVPFIEITIPDKNNQQLTAVLAEMPMNHVRVKTNNKDYITGIELPKIFRGKIAGLQARHDVLLTLAPDYISFTAYLPGETITVEQDSRQNGAYVLLNSADLVYKTNPFTCGLSDTKPVDKTEQQHFSKVNSTLAASDKCTFVFVDCTNRLFRNRGENVQNTINYVYSIWNGAGNAFRNEQLNVLISEINVWTASDPFDVSSSTTVANKSFADFYRDNYWGNMAMLLDWSTLNAAIAGGYGWAKSVEPNTCGNYIASPSPAWNFGSFIYNNLNPAVFGTLSYSNFPAAAIAHQVYISVHELGHLFSSWHTHSCNWPGGPIDNCVALEGSCTATGMLPATGGTFMSYCDQTSVGNNFNNGFGTLPGDTIRQFVVNNACISNCTSCVANDVIGNIAVSGFQQKEVTNQLIANGNLTTPNGFLKLDAGSRVVLQPGFRVTEGNKVQVIIDGCGGIR
ncbi:MAG TPA: M12 family metallo-peptidase [Ferruginibacter sp.]|nr:M12 family metallo-peptidase [Ferruginibacter sp.]